MKAEKITPIHPGSKIWSRRLRKKTKEVASRLDRDQFDLGVLLWRAYDTPIDGNPQNAPVFTSWGYLTFKEYAEGELDLRGRKAERLRLIGRCLDVGLVDTPAELRERFIGLGWSKAREVSRIFLHVSDDATVEAWVGFAEANAFPITEHTVNKKLDQMDFDEEGVYIPPTKVEVGDQPAAAASQLPEPERRKQWNFTCLNDQIDTVREALERAQEMAQFQGNPNHTYKRSNLLSLICLDFLATNDFGKKGGDDETRAKYVKRLEDFTGLKLVALKNTPDGMDILHGTHHLAELAEELDADEDA